MLQLDTRALGFRDGREVKPSADIEMKSLPDGTEQLIIHKAQAEDQGNYRISATNVAGSMSSKAPLSVQSKLRVGTASRCLRYHCCLL